MKGIFLLIFICTSVLSYGQIENRWQPDSIYSNHKVRKICVYLNSPKDLSEIVEFDEYGKRTRSIEYSASYNRKTRKQKFIESIKLYEYDSENRLTQIFDSLGTGKITFQYDKNGKMISSKKYNRQSIKPSSVTEYFYDPFKSTTRRVIDSIIVYQKTKEYDQDFYVKRFYGYYLEPKLKKITTNDDGMANTFAYSDRTDLQKFEDDETIKNTFNSEGQLIKSEVKSVYMNDRINEYELNYDYYDNGLLKSVHGYVPRYFGYEFWK